MYVSECEVWMMIILMIMILISLIGASLRFAWGLTKFLFGLGLFCICPLLFVLAVLFGAFHAVWLPIVIVGLIFGRGFMRAI